MGCASHGASPGHTGDGDGVPQNPVETPTAQCPWAVVGDPVDVEGSFGIASVAIALEATTGRPVLALRAWADQYQFTSSVFVRRWDGARWVALGGALEVMPHGNGENPQISAGPDGIVVTWAENDPVQQGHDQGYAKRWDDASGAWIDLGGALNHDTNWVSRHPVIAIDATGAPVVAWEEPFSTPWAGYALNVARWDGNAWVSLGEHAVMSDRLVRSPAMTHDPTGGVLVGVLRDNGLPGDLTGAPVVDQWTGAGPWSGDFKDIPGFATGLAIGATSETVYLAVETHQTSIFASSINRWDAAGHTWQTLPPFSLDLLFDPALAADGAALIAAQFRTPATFAVKRWSGGQWTALCDGVFQQRRDTPSHRHAIVIDGTGIATAAHLAERSSGHDDVVVRQGSVR